jgi:anti-sigma-K factor RskA
MRISAKALPQHIIDAMSSPDDRAALGVSCTAERSKNLANAAEDEIQRAVEAYCVLLGFERLTKENIERAKTDPAFPRRGWQFHLSKLGAKKNPMLPDLTLFDRRSERYLWLELKAARGAVRPLQQILIDAGFWKVARSAEVATGIIKEWVAQLVRVRAN